MWIPNFEPFQLLGTIHGIGTDFGTFAMATASLLMVVQMTMVTNKEFCRPTSLGQQAVILLNCCYILETRYRSKYTHSYVNFRVLVYNSPKYSKISTFHLNFFGLLQQPFGTLLLISTNFSFQFLKTWFTTILSTCSFTYVSPFIILLLYLHYLLGLKLNLFIEQSQYIPELSDTAGARVVVHDQGQMPFPNNEGYSVLPSRSTSFGIRRVRREVYIWPKLCLGRESLRGNILGLKLQLISISGSSN